MKHFLFHQRTMLLFVFPQARKDQEIAGALNSSRIRKANKKYRAARIRGKS